MNIRIELDTKNAIAAKVYVDGKLQSRINRVWLDIEAGLVRDFRMRKARKTTDPTYLYFMEELQGHRMVVPDGQGG